MVAVATSDAANVALAARDILDRETYLGSFMEDAGDLRVDVNCNRPGVDWRVKAE